MKQPIIVYVIRDEKGIIQKSSLRKDELFELKEKHPNWEIERIEER